MDSADSAASLVPMVDVRLSSEAQVDLVAQAASVAAAEMGLKVHSVAAAEVGLAADSVRALAAVASAAESSQETTCHLLTLALRARGCTELADATRVDLDYLARTKVLAALCNVDDQDLTH